MIRYNYVISQPTNQKTAFEWLNKTFEVQSRSLFFGKNRSLIKNKLNES